MNEKREKGNEKEKRIREESKDGCKKEGRGMGEGNKVVSK